MSNQELHNVSCYASIAVLVILVLCLLGMVNLSCCVRSVRLDSMEGMTNGIDADFAKSIGSDRTTQMILSGPDLRQATGMTQAYFPGQDVPLAVGQPFSMYGSGASSQNGFQSRMNETPVFWNQGNIADVVAYETGVRQHDATPEFATEGYSNTKTGFATRDAMMNPY